MKKLASRLIQLTIAMALALSLAPWAAAQDDTVRQTTADNARRLLASIYFDDWQEYGLPENAYAENDFALGQQIPSYDLVDGQLVPTEIFCFPLYCQGQLSSLISSFYAGDTLESGIESAGDIGGLLGSTRVFAFVYAYDGFYLVKSDGVFLVREYTPDQGLSEITAEGVDILLSQLISDLSSADTDLTELEGIDMLIAELQTPQQETPELTTVSPVTAVNDDHSTAIVLGVLLGIIALTAAAVGIYSISNRSKKS